MTGWLLYRRGSYSGNFRQGLGIGWASGRRIAYSIGDEPSFRANRRRFGRSAQWARVGRRLGRRIEKGGVVGQGEVPICRAIRPVYERALYRTGKIISIFRFFHYYSALILCFKHTIIL